VALAPADRISPYEIQALLGVGGMGEVYRGRDTRLGRECRAEGDRAAAGRGLRARNAPEAAPFIKRPEYRKGWQDILKMTT
jgi:serine/threonine protein kinase